MLPDVINGTFEFAGAFFVAISIRKILQDKDVKGVHWLHIGFFTVWGMWNLYYYPYLDQWWSFYGGIALVAANLTYVLLLIRYSRRAI